MPDQRQALSFLSRPNRCIENESPAFLSSLGFMINFKEIFSVTLILFSVIDILGSIPVVISILKRDGRIHAEKATIISALLMVVFLYLGQSNQDRSTPGNRSALFEAPVSRSS